MVNLESRTPERKQFNVTLDVGLEHVLRYAVDAYNSQASGERMTRDRAIEVAIREYLRARKSDLLGEMDTLRSLLDQI